jgi:hypothetical protein
MTGSGETPDSWAPPPAAPSPSKITAWLRRHWKGLAIGTIALVIGVGIGASGSSGDVGKKDDQIKAQGATIRDLAAKNADLQKRVNDRAARIAEDKAHAASVKADRQAARERAAAAARAKAAATAAAAKARADAAAKAQADAAAAAVAEAARKNTIDGDGVYAIGPDVNPGQWRTSGGAGCYYAVLNSPDTSDIATNNITDGPAIVDLPLGKYFDTSSCGSWTHS